jgi:hypothetical protein
MNDRVVKTENFKAAAALLASAIPGDNARRYALDLADDGTLVVRVALDPAVGLDTGVSDDETAIYPVPFVIAVRARARLSVLSPVSVSADTDSD